MSDTMRGYKAFDTDADGGLCCRDMAYEVGKEYALDGAPALCERGYHFCGRLVDCYDFYPSAYSRICEVEASGTIITGDDGKSVTDHIRIVRELDRSEVLGLANSGKGCTGIRNSGDRNSGDYNSGDYNSGYRNSGDYNSGYRNSGDRNSGYCNSGYRNSGDRNSGDYNSTNFSAGVLCTQEPECLIFDKPSGMTLREWRGTEAAYLMDDIWTDGTGKPDYAGWWDRLDGDKRATILAIPNFDADKWLRITGIDVAGDAR